MVNSCSAYGCKNRNSKGSTITFHRFPLNNKSLLKLWLYQIKRGGWEPSKYSVICSEHFTEDCFIMKGAGSGRRTLKSDALPTKFSMAIYSEPPKRTFPGRKAKDVEMENNEKKEEEEKKDEEMKDAEVEVKNGETDEDEAEEKKNEDSQENENKEESENGESKEEKDENVPEESESQQDDDDADD